jgi:hypothetical protein
VIGAFLAVGAALIAFFAASKQAAAIRSVARTQAETQYEARQLGHAAIRRQIAAYAYSALNSAAHLIIATQFPTDRGPFTDVIQRLIDRLASLDTAEALDDQTASKALNELSYIQTGLYRLSRRWDLGDKSDRSRFRIRVNAYRVFWGAEGVAKALQSQDAIRYASTIRQRHADLFEPLAVEAQASRTQIKLEEDAQ